ncbi:hypothetical protein U1Q18_027605, partial [Sarracenia purpurea var. burkii]
GIAIVSDLMNNSHLMVNSTKFRGYPSVHKPGKSGNDSRVLFNRFHALSSPDFEDYEECFPSLPGANTRAPIKELSTVVKVCEAPHCVTTSIENYDHAEEGRRLEKMNVVALNRAKKGRIPLNQDEISHLETWLVKYRASNAQNPNQKFPSVASKCSKKESDFAITR